MPYFLRSLARASRVRSPSAFSRLRSSRLYSTSARAMPSRTAPACPETPPPATVARMSNLSAGLVGNLGGLVLLGGGLGGKEASSERLWVRAWPAPGPSKTPPDAAFRGRVASYATAL